MVYEPAEKYTFFACVCRVSKIGHDEGMISKPRELQTCVMFEICQVLLSADGLFQWRWLLYMDVTEFVLPTNMHKLNGSIRNLTIGNLFWTTQSGAVRVSQTGKVMRKMMIYQRILGPVFLPDHVFHYITKIYIDHHWSCHILIWTTIALSIVVTDHVQKDYMFLRIGPSNFDLYPICVNLPILKNQNI